MHQKIEKMKIINDKYYAVKRIMDMDETPTCQLEDSLEMILIDSSFPTIKIPKYQYVNLINSEKGTEAIRKLMDILFDESIFSGKSATFIKNNFPNEYKFILNFISFKYKMKYSEINKCLTNKCIQNRTNK